MARPLDSFQLARPENPDEYRGRWSRKVSQAPFWPVATDAIIADTTHLSVDQFGAYMLLMFAQWRQNGKPLPDNNDMLSRICRVTQTRWKKGLRPILEPFFEITELGWSQKRVEKDFKIVIEKIQKNRERGARGGKAKARKYKETRVANARNFEDSKQCSNPGKSLPNHEPYRRSAPSPMGKRGTSSSHEDSAGRETATSNSRPGNECLQGEPSPGPHAGKQNPTPEQEATWEQAKDELQRRMESRDFTWVELLQLLEVTGDVVTLAAPSRLICDRATELGGRIRDALQDAGMPVSTVRLAVFNPIEKEKRPVNSDQR